MGKIRYVFLQPDCHECQLTTYEVSMKYAINGRFYSQKLTGVQRYAREIVRELDALPIADNVCILIADDAVDLPEFQRMKVVRLGEKANQTWLQLAAPFYCMANHLISVNLCGAGPMLSPGIVVAHDVGFFRHPDFVSRAFYLWGKCQMHNTMLRAKSVITVSNFSKKEINDIFKAGRKEIEVVPCAWQHILRVKEDAAVLDKNELREKGYYFAMSSVTKNKNMDWIYRTARLNPASRFVIAGGFDEKVFGAGGLSEMENVLFLGRISDGEAVALMKNCRGFLFPTFYEGFGIPPLEAMACGASIAVSDTEVMHEVYGDAAHYIDPACPCKDIDGLFSEECASPDMVLAKYDWARSARMLAQAMKDVS